MPLEKPKVGTLVSHHNLKDLILDASCGLEYTEMVLTKHTNTEETESHDIRLIK